MRRGFLLGSLLFFAAACAACAASDARRTPVVEAVARVLPSVVNISTARVVDKAYDTPFPAVAETPGEPASLGSGVVVDACGLVLTNAHVVHRASLIHVTASDGTRHVAKEVASDTVNDLALLAIVDAPADKFFTPIAMGRPDDLMLGEPVIAIGNPYGLGNSITCGVLSAVNRKLYAGGRAVFSDLLQVDAAINPGNSGGPLVNINAELIGVNEVVLEKAEGIGFAIPLRRVLGLLAKWLVPERFGDNRLGLIPGVGVEDGRPAVVVAEVEPDTPAARAGLRPGMRIVRFNGEPVSSLMDVSGRLWRLRAGQRAEFTLGDGRVASVLVERFPEMDGASLAEARLGLGLQPLTPQLAAALGYPPFNALVVSDVKGDIPGIQRGDILARLGDVQLHGLSDIPKALHRLRRGDRIEASVITLIRSQGRLFLLRRQVELDVL